MTLHQNSSITLSSTFSRRPLMNQGWVSTRRRPFRHAERIDLRRFAPSQTLSDGPQMKSTSSNTETCPPLLHSLIHEGNSSRHHPCRPKRSPVPFMISTEPANMLAKIRRLPESPRKAERIILPNAKILICFSEKNRCDSVASDFRLDWAKTHKPSLIGA